MTNREFMNEIIKTVDLVAPMVDDNAVDKLNGIKELAVLEIEKLDEKNAKRKEKPSKTQIENEPIIKAIKEFLEGCDDFVPAKTIATALEISTNKVSSLAKKIENIEIEEIKFEKRKVNGYRLAIEED
jgi:biotin operon repressor